MKLQENVKQAVNKRSQFDLSFDGVLTQNWGDLVPFVCKEMVPGDTFTCDSSVFVRLAPLASPTYGRIHGYINYFFVPNRILLNNDLWEDFIRGGVTGMSEYNLPFVQSSILYGCSVSDSSTGVTDKDARNVRKLATYLGLPDPLLMQGGNLRLSVLPWAAYNRIYGDYYFPWGVEDDADVEALYFKKFNSGGINSQLDLGMPRVKYFSLKHASFKKDYLTTAQTRPQRGGNVFAPAQTRIDALSGDSTIVNPDNINPELPANYAVSSLGIRWAQSVQRFLERNSVAGARYFEQILARFGISIPAERLQRSEYIGGRDFWINVMDVTSTSDTSGQGDGGASLGSLAGKGVGLGQSEFSYTSQDYGFFVGIVHLMPESGCPQGIDRMFFRDSRYDYFTPELEDTGNQPIYYSEVFGEPFVNGSESFSYETGVFGYIPRYAEYKFSKPLLAGDFRLGLFNSDNNYDPSQLNDMASMHLYRLFGIGQSGYDIPQLNSDWLILDNSKQFEFNRIFQDTNEDFDHFFTNIQVNLRASRPMLGYLETSTPFQLDENHNTVSIPAFGARL